MSRQFSVWQGKGEEFGELTRLISTIFNRRSLGGELQASGMGEI